MHKQPLKVGDKVINGRFVYSVAAVDQTNGFCTLVNRDGKTITQHQSGESFDEGLFRVIAQTMLDE